MAQIELVPLTEEHLGALSVLETLCFSEPWSEEALRILTKENAFGVVALSDGQVVAYGGMTYVLDEGSVTNIAVHPDRRRQGYGRAVLRRMLLEAEQRALSFVFLEARESNLAARALYKAVGFEECGVRKNFYRKPTESAVQMVWKGRKQI